MNNEKYSSIFFDKAQKYDSQVKYGLKEEPLYLKSIQEIMKTFDELQSDIINKNLDKIQSFKLQFYSEFEDFKKGVQNNLELYRLQLMLSASDVNQYMSKINELFKSNEDYLSHLLFVTTGFVDNKVSEQNFHLITMFIHKQRNIPDGQDYFEISNENFSDNGKKILDIINQIGGIEKITGEINLSNITIQDLNLNNPNNAIAFNNSGDLKKNSMVKN